MGKTSYKNTSELIRDIATKVDDLNNGNLNITELDTLVNASKDLYEHLIILRYKAFDTHGEPDSISIEAITHIEEKIEQTEETSTNEPEAAEEPSIDFTPFSESTIEEEQDEQPSFDFTLDDEPENTAESKAVDTPIGPKAEEDEREAEENGNSLNDVFKKDDDLSLRKKLQNTPVSDLKSHISIAKKFEYISNMFEGDPTAYEEAIEFLNTCASGSDARLKLNEYTTKYSWDLEDKSIVKFIELVERRYL